MPTSGEQDIDYNQLIADYEYNKQRLLSDARHG